MYPNLDALIARIALSLWTSDRRVERVPVMRVVEPWETANIAPFPYLGSEWRFFVASLDHSPSFEGI